MSAFNVPALIARKRDGHALTTEEIIEFITRVVRKDVPGEQIGAMLMAIFLKGMAPHETIALTKALQNSGEVLSWPEYPGMVVDKHSTGGVGDKISLPLAPALAACGAKVPMISGRGLGHTGGTLDKLESIPGFSVSVSGERMKTIMATVGCCIAGQTESLVPGDRILYAIRDVTSTVESVPLITASIVSKKVAEGLSSLILDVKVGRAAFMKTMEQALELGKSMVEAGNGAGVKTLGLVTRMDVPIGNMIGNAVEVAESVACLQGKGPKDLDDLVVLQGGYLLHLNGMAATPAEGMGMIRRVLDDGSALARFRDMVAAQGATAETAAALCADPWSVLPRAAHQTPLVAAAGGFVVDIEAMVLARTVCEMGAGRLKTTDLVDHAVGLQLCVVVGDAVVAGQAWMVVHHNKPLLPEQLAALQSALVLAADRVAPVPRGVGIIEGPGAATFKPL